MPYQSFYMAVNAGQYSYRTIEKCFYRTQHGNFKENKNKNNTYT